MGLKIVTLRRDTPPAGMEIGEKLLFISARKNGPCAYADCPGIARMETISTIMRKDTIGLRIFVL